MLLFPKRITWWLKTAGGGGGGGGGDGGGFFLARSQSGEKVRRSFSDNHFYFILFLSGDQLVHTNSTF